MAFNRKATKDLPRARRSLLASAARYTFDGAQAWRGQIPAGDRRWQVEAWRHYDMCGELRFATGWKANACSRAIMFAAEVDPDTGRTTGPTENQTIRDIAGAVLGGPAKRPGHIRTMIINLEMAGEVYVVVIAEKNRGDGDTWLVISGTEMFQQGNTVEFTHPETGEKTTVGPKDTLIRIWHPHPRLQLAADSPVRALLPTLREIEKSSQNIAARLDSRLAGAGLLVTPAEADFPDADDSEPEEDAGLASVLRRNMSASLRDPGSAASQVPLIAEVPYEFADGFKHITFETPLSKEVIALRTESLARLAVGLNIPREVIEGMGESNHWSAEQVSEDAYERHLVPDLDTIANGLTVAYLHPVAKVAGVPDVELYELEFDGSDLVGEPDPLDKVMELLDRGLITPEAALTMLHVPDDFAPNQDQHLRALAQKLVLAAPALFSDPTIRRLLGFDPAIEASAPQITAAAQPTMPVEAASIAVRYALERAGNRLLQTQRLKDEFAAVPRHELHVKLRPNGRHGDLLDGAWRHVPQLAALWDLDTYTRRLIDAGIPHEDEILTQWMASRGQ